jgi:hypothetical protein
MRLHMTRVLAVVGVLAVTLVTGAAYTLANGQAAAICPDGEVGVTVHWADAQDALFCAVADGLQGMPTSAIVGLVVRGPDDALSTVDVAPAPNFATDAQVPPAANIASDARATSSHSISNSSSSSTTCVNGHCTTITNQVSCADGACSSQP